MLLFLGGKRLAGNPTGSDLVREAPRANLASISKVEGSGREIRVGEVTDALPPRVSDAVASPVRSEGGTSISRPTWRQSETDVGDVNPNYETKKSFLNGKEVPYATRGSSRPDLYITGSSIEVKNYNVTNRSGRNSLINIVSNQVNQRISDLPGSTKQTIIIDVRGQQVTNDVLRQIRTSILEKCNTDVLIQFMR